MVVVEKAAIGKFVKGLCAVVIPEEKKHLPVTMKGDRMAMLKDLKIFVEEAAEQYQKMVLFPYGNWWIQDFVNLGKEAAEKKTEFYNFRVEVSSLHSTSLNQNIVNVLRKAHADASSAVLELTANGWTQLIENFIPYAKIAKFRNFISKDDKHRATTVWHVSKNHVESNSAMLKTKTDVHTIKPSQNVVLLCPDAITPINVVTKPPYTYDGSWGWWDIIKMNRRINTDLLPGIVYYWLRQQNEHGFLQNVIVTEGEVLQKGCIIILNSYSLEFTLSMEAFSTFENGDYELLPDSVLILDKKKKNDQNLESTGKIKTNAQSAKAFTVSSSSFKAGNKYVTFFDEEDVFCKGSPDIISIAKYDFKQKNNYGSLIVSRQDRRRMHQWSYNNSFSSLNSINKSFRKYCTDQCWLLWPVAPPQFTHEDYDVTDLCYLIENKKSGCRLGLVNDSIEDQYVGLISAHEAVDDYQKWQFLASEEDGFVEIYQPVSGVRLGLSSFEENISQTNSLEKSPSMTGSRYHNVDGTNPLDFERFDELEQEDIERRKFIHRHHWTIIPFKAIEQHTQEGDTNGNIPKNNYNPFLGGENGFTKSRIYSRPTLPQSLKVLTEGGLIFRNEYKIHFNVAYKDNPSTVYSLKDMVIVKPNENIQAHKNVEIVITQHNYSIDTDDKKSIALKAGKEYETYFPPNDPLYKLNPDLLNETQLLEAKKNRGGFKLVHIDTNGVEFRLGAVQNNGKVYATSSTDISLSEVWDFHLGLRVGNQFTYRIKNVQMNKYLHVSPGGGFGWTNLNDNFAPSYWALESNEYEMSDKSVVLNHADNNVLEFSSFVTSKITPTSMDTPTLKEGVLSPRGSTTAETWKIIGLDDLGNIESDKDEDLFKLIASNKKDLIQIALWKQPSMDLYPYVRTILDNKDRPLLEYFLENNEVLLHWKDNETGFNISEYISHIGWEEGKEFIKNHGNPSNICMGKFIWLNS